MVGCRRRHGRSSCVVVGRADASPPRVCLACDLVALAEVVGGDRRRTARAARGRWRRAPQDRVAGVATPGRRRARPRLSALAPCLGACAPRRVARRVPGLRARVGDARVVGVDGCVQFAALARVVLAAGDPRRAPRVGVGRRRQARRALLTVGSSAIARDLEVGAVRMARRGGSSWARGSSGWGARARAPRPRARRRGARSARRRRRWLVVRSVFGTGFV